VEMCWNKTSKYQHYDSAGFFYDCGWFLHGSQVAFNFLMEMPMKLP